MNHTELVIDNASVFFGTLGAVITAGAAAWKLHFAHHFRLKEANDLIGRISQTIHTLTDDDKVAIDAYIARVSTTNQQETRCLLNTRQMLENLAEYAPDWLFCFRCLIDLGTGTHSTQTQRNKVDEALAASSFFNFPWSDLAQSIEVLLKQCRELHESVQVVHLSCYQ